MMRIEKLAGFIILNIVFWCNFIPPTAIGEYGDRWTLHVDVTTPGGDKTTLGGSAGF
jgi:hypothetical protein